jgi:uncharacterized membrane protein HdeD (DUF308 family)
MVLIGWLMLAAGVLLAAGAVALRQRKVAAWYTLMIVAACLLLLGTAFAFSLTVGDRGGGTVRD